MERDSSAATRDFQRKCECLRLPFPLCRQWTMEWKWSAYSLFINGATFPEGDRRNRRKSALSSGSGLKGASAETIRLRNQERGGATTAKDTRQTPTTKEQPQNRSENGESKPGRRSHCVRPGKRSSVFRFPTFIFRGSCGESSVQQAVMRKRCLRERFSRTSSGGNFFAPSPGTPPPP